MVFGIIQRLCKIAYQMEKNFQLRKRDDRGHVASLALHKLTVDSVVREVTLKNPRELCDQYIIPMYPESQWHAVVLLSQLYRPVDEPAEDKSGRIHLRKPDEILDISFP